MEGKGLNEEREGGKVESRGMEGWRERRDALEDREASREDLKHLGVK